MKKTILLSVALVMVLALASFSFAGCKDGADPEVVVETVTETVVETVEVTSDEPVELLIWTEPIEATLANVGFSWDACIEKYKADTGATTEIKVVDEFFCSIVGNNSSLE